MSAQQHSALARKSVTRVAQSRSHSRVDRSDPERRVDRSIHRGCARPSCADRTPWRWAARHGPSSHSPPSQHDLPCSRHSVSSHSSHRLAATTAPTAVPARRVPRSCERVLSAPELEGGTFAARPVPANRTGRQPLSSIVVITTVCQSSILLTVVGAAAAATLGDERHAVPRAWKVVLRWRAV